MKILSFTLQYAVWHYSRALFDIIGIIQNFVWFLYHYFSLPILARTFFTPWRRMNILHEKREGFNTFFSSLVVNIMMRLVGIIMRIIIILIGIFAIFAMSAFGIIFLIFWLFLPFIILALFVAGVREFI